MEKIEVGSTIRGFTILRKEKLSNRSIVWVGTCPNPNCNEERKASARILKDESASLLCHRCVHRVGFGQETLSDEEQTLNRRFRSYKSNAKKRGYKFFLTKEEFRDLIYSDCHYCGLPPQKSNDKQLRANHNGVDRIDNSLDYTVENSVSCCKICNYMKRELSENEFIEHITRISSRFNINLS